MNYLHLDKLTPGTIGVFLVVIVLAWLLYKATKHLVMGLLCLIVAVTAAGYFTGVVSPAKALHAAEAVGKNGLQAAESQAKVLGEKAEGVITEEAHAVQREAEKRAAK